MLQKQFRNYCSAGPMNKGDYVMKHHVTVHHRSVYPDFLTPRCQLDLLRKAVERHITKMFRTIDPLKGCVRHVSLDSQCIGMHGSRDSQSTYPEDTSRATKDIHSKESHQRGRSLCTSYKLLKGHIEHNEESSENGDESCLAIQRLDLEVGDWYCQRGQTTQDTKDDAYVPDVDMSNGGHK